MIISVNNEREKELFDNFMFFISEYIDSDEMKQLMVKEGHEFKEHEIDFLQTGLHEATIKVDKSVWDIVMDSDNLTGVCKYCGEEWRGIDNENVLPIEEYERFLNLDKENSYHAECLRDNQCVECGSDDSNVVITDIGIVCESCYKDRELEGELK